MIITEASHTFNQLSADQNSYVQNLFAETEIPFTETIDLTDAEKDLGTVNCGLYGPIMGDPPVPEDEVQYRKTRSRSRCCARESRQVTKVTIIAGPYKGYPCVMYAAFGGPMVPKEPDDPNMTLDEIAASKAFWAEHALSEVDEELPGWIIAAGRFPTLISNLDDIVASYACARDLLADGATRKEAEVLTRAVKFVTGRHFGPDMLSAMDAFLKEQEEAATKKKEDEEKGAPIEMP